MLKQSVISVSAAIAASTFLSPLAFADSQKLDQAQIAKPQAATSAATVTISADELQALKAQLQALNSKVDKLESAQNAQSSSNSKASTTSDNTIVRTQEQTEVIPNKAPLFRGENIYIESDAEYKDTLLEQLSSSQTALGLLNMNSKFHTPGLVFGGYLEGDVQGWWGNSFNYDISNNNTPNMKQYQRGVGAYLTTANLDFLANINSWMQAFMTINGSQDGISGINNAILVLGNLDKSPFFASLGKSRPALGVFGGGGPWTAGLTQAYFRPTQLTNITVGYNHDGLTTYVAGWRNDSTKAPTNGGQYDFVYSAFYQGNLSKDLSYTINAGYMNNLAGSGAGAVNGENGNSNTINAGPRNPVLNLEGSIAYDVYSANAGITETLFDRTYTGSYKDANGGTVNVTQNGRSGAWYVQANYAPTIMTKPVTFSVAYNGAYNTEAMQAALSGDASPGIYVMGMKREVIASAQSEVMTNVLLGLEYAWLQTYSQGHGNAVTMDVSVYF